MGGATWVRLASILIACGAAAVGVRAASSSGASGIEGAPGTPSSPASTWQGEVTSNDGTYLLRYQILPEDFEVGDLFEMRVEVQRADGAPVSETLTVDARMPEHGHGMNREPVVERAPEGDFEAQNLLFHMPGYWEVYLDLTRGAVTERAQFSMDLE